MVSVATGTELPSSHEISKTGVKHLHRYWAKNIAFRERRLRELDFHEEINLDLILLGVLGLGLEQTITNMYTTNDFASFEDWVLEVNNGVLDRNKIAQFNNLLDNTDAPSIEADEQVLSQADMDFFNENGYIILRNAVPKEDCAATIAMICDFLKIDLNYPETWYTQNPARQGIMVQLFQHPLLQKNRDTTLIRKAYEQLWGRTDIWVNTDRVGFNPPETDRWKFPGPRLHWDVSIEPPIPFGLQGILYLSDTKADQGAFSLIPGFHKKMEAWVDSLPEGADPRTQDLYQLGVTPIAANAGDFIIWHQALPHGSSPNTSVLPRIVQYLNYQPVNAKVMKVWK